MDSGRWQRAQVEDRPQTLPGEVVRSVPTPHRTSRYAGFLPGRSPPATEGVGGPSLSASSGSGGASGRAELSACLSLLAALPEGAAFGELPDAGHNDVPYQDPAAYLKAIAAFFERLE